MDCSSVQLDGGQTTKLVMHGRIRGAYIALSPLRSSPCMLVGNRGTYCHRTRHH
jgi:hypothetical protein